MRERRRPRRAAAGLGAVGGAVRGVDRPARRASAAARSPSCGRGVRPTAAARGRCRGPARGRRASGRRGWSPSRPCRRTRPPSRVRSRRSRPTDAAQSRGTPSTPAHACAIGTSAAAGKNSRSSAVRARIVRSCVRPSRVDARPEAVGHAAAAERDPVVGGALRVHVHVGEVAEHLAPAPSRSAPRPPAAAARSRSSTSSSAARRGAGPCRSGVKPSVARRTNGARTSPRAVTARPGAISVTRVSSWITTPSRSTAAASPEASFAAWMRAACGCQSPPTAPATASRDAVVAASHSSTSVCGHSRSSAAEARRRASCAGVRAMFSSPPLTMSASMPSRAATAITSSTVSLRARCCAIAASRPCDLAYCARPPVTEFVSQPPLRPEAPKPAKRCSSTTIRRSGWRVFR